MRLRFINGKYDNFILLHICNNADMKKLIFSIFLILTVTGCTDVSKSLNTETTDNEVQTLTPQKHKIDIMEEKCLSKADTNAEMRDCAYKAMDTWFLEIDKNLAILKKQLPPEKYKAVIDAQIQWKKYQEAEFIANNEVIFDKMGSIYRVSSTSQKVNLVKERALELESFVYYSQQP